MKNVSKINQKSIKNEPNMYQKWTKNRSKLRSGGLQGRFGGLLGRLGRSKGFLRASWIVLEASWKRLGREKWPTWLQLGPKLGPKLELKWIKNPSKNRSKNRWLLGSVFGRILVDLGRENEGKLAPKWDQKLMLTSKGRFYKNTYEANWILMIFEVSEGRSWEQKSIKNWCKNRALDGMHLGIDFWAILVDFGCQVGEKNRSKMVSQKRLKKERQQDGRQSAPRACDSAGPDRPEPRESG